MELLQVPDDDIWWYLLSKIICATKDYYMRQWECTLLSEFRLQHIRHLRNWKPSYMLVEDSSRCQVQ